MKIPVIGRGGIATYTDAIEMILAGATMVAVGMMNFTDPETVSHVIDGMKRYMVDTGTERISDLIGIL